MHTANTTNTPDMAEVIAMGYDDAFTILYKAYEAALIEEHVDGETTAREKILNIHHYLDNAFNQEAL